MRYGRSVGWSERLSGHANILSHVFVIFFSLLTKHSSNILYSTMLKTIKDIEIYE